MNNDTYNISTSGRVFRIALSLGLVMVTISSAAPLDQLVYLPFISIYAGITGFIGADPVNALMNKISEKIAAKPGCASQSSWLTQ